MKLGEAVYKSQQKDPSAKPDDQESKTEDKDKEDVVDADFEDVKDEKDAKDSKEDKEKSA
jgi:molecular chaperone DnaK